MTFLDRLDKGLEYTYMPASIIGGASMMVCIFKMFRYRNTKNIQDVIIWQVRRVFAFKGPSLYARICLEKTFDNSRSSLGSDYSLGGMCYILHLFGEMYHFN